MTKHICIILVFMFLICLCACDSSTTEKNDKTNTNNYNETIITKDEAEGEAASALYRQLQILYGKNSDYDVSQTKYSVGSITGSSSSGYTVNGTYSMYDKYGNFKKRDNFSVKVRSDGYASVTEY